MEDEKFIKELKEGVTRKKLPTAGDIGEGYKSPFKEEVPKDSEFVAPLPEKKESKAEVFNKARELHEQGKTPEEILQTLRDQNYSYENIEDAIAKLTETKEEKKEEPKEEELKEELPRAEKLSEIEEIERRLESPPPRREPILEEKMEYAPLFIKIEKYRETLETVEDLENYLKAMSKLFEIVNELERIRTKNISALTKMYHRAVQTASKLYGGLLKPKGMKLEGGVVSESEIEKMDSVIKDLNEELAALREELDKIRGA